MLDFDGVIADSLSVFSACLLDLSRQWGLARPTTLAEFLRLFDTNLYEGLAAGGLSEAARAPFIAQLGDRLTRELPRCAPFPGIPQALADLATCGPLVVVTSSVTAVVRDWLDRQGIVGVTDVLGADRGTGKVAKIRSVMGGYVDAASAYYVGDTCGDVREGRAAGARTVAVTWGWHEEAALAALRPDFLVRNPAQLGALGN